jgi:hypothetical protein
VLINNKKGMEMNVSESELRLDAFNRFCNELTLAKLLSGDENQHLVFEDSYKAAVAEMINNIAIAAELKDQISLEQIYLSKKSSLH